MFVAFLCVCALYWVEIYYEEKERKKNIEALPCITLFLVFAFCAFHSTLIFCERKRKSIYLKFSTQNLK
jgi:hypothetical protein